MSSSQVSHLKQGMTTPQPGTIALNNVSRIAHRIKLMARTLHYNYTLFEDFGNNVICDYTVLS